MKAYTQNLGLNITEIASFEHHLTNCMMVEIGTLLRTYGIESIHFDQLPEDSFYRPRATDEYFGEVIGVKIDNEDDIALYMRKGEEIKEVKIENTRLYYEGIKSVLYAVDECTSRRKRKELREMGVIIPMSAKKYMED